MNFLEKFVSVGRSVDADAEANSNQQTDKAEKQGDISSNQTVDGEQESSQNMQSKTYTEEQMQELLSQKQDEWQREYLDNLPDGDKLRMQSILKDEEIAKLKAEISKRDLQKLIFEKLEKDRLPNSVEQFIIYSDEKGTFDSYDKVKEVFNQAVEDSVNLRLKGKTPVFSTNQSKSTDLFTNHFK